MRIESCIIVAKGNKKFFHAFFPQMIYGQMAIFCKTLLLLCTPEQRRGALKKDKSTVDELFGSGCFHSLGTHILLRIYDFAETKKKTQSGYSNLGK